MSSNYRRVPQRESSNAGGGANPEGGTATTSNNNNNNNSEVVRSKSERLQDKLVARKLLAFLFLFYLPYKKTGCLTCSFFLFFFFFF
jgi:hypothetical protein